MKITQEKKQDILKKSKNLEDLKVFLKKEFVGIDKVIDGVVDTMAPFYLFPESLSKPLVINLWGMTATGKTSLVHNIVEFLNLKSSFFKFEIGEYNDSNEKLKTELSNKIKRTDSKNLVLLLDEFQLGRTINEEGKENNRTSLRPIWELIDSGQIAKYNSLNFFEVSTIVHKLKKCLELGVKVNNRGIVIENEDIYNAMMEDGYCYRVVDFSVSTLKEELDEEEVASGSDVVTPQGGIPKNQNEYKPRFAKVDKDDDSWQPTSSKKFLRKPYFIKKDMFGKLFNVDPDFFNHIYNMPKNRHHFERAGKELVQFIETEFLDKQPLMSMEDYSQSLIFCLGNIDEAYNMTHSTNPDADADIFHEHSLKITLPKIKDALSRRFRMEQIGRLGNNHFIYPSLNKKSYERIISLYLKKRASYINKTHGIKVKFDKSVNDILYKEGVFPTQGVRPLLSTFNQLIDSYTTKAISDIIRNDLYKTDTVEWVYDSEKYEINAINKESGKGKKFSYDIELKVDNLRHSDMSEKQAYTAIHEAGHALISAIALNIAPKEVVSKTASVSEGYCSIERPSTKTRSFYEKEIMMFLGGLEAEKLIFGEIGNGGYSDLSMATESAFNMVKRFGMHGKLFHISAVSDTSLTGVFVKDDAYEQAVQDIVNTAQEKARDILKENIDMLLKMGDHLSTNSKMNMSEVKEMFKPLNIKWKTKDSYYSFKKTIKDKIEERKSRGYKS